MSARLKYNKFNEIAGEMTARADMVTRKAAFDCERIAKGLAPVDTGNLQGSIYVDGAKSGLSGDTVVYSVIAGAEYAAAVEYGADKGTSFTPGQPFLTPAFNQVAAGWLVALGQLSRGVRYSGAAKFDRDRGE